MEASASRCSGFRIDSLLSLQPPDALLCRADPPELSPGSSCSAPASPRWEPPPRPEAPLLPGRLQPRSASSSFLIRDILADCAPCSHPVQDGSEPGLPEPLQSGREEDYEARSQSSCSDSGVQSSSSDPAAAAARLRKPRKARTAFSDQQLSRLERSFHKQKYLSVQDRMELAAALQLSDTQVKTWYQNRRTKWKRQSAVGLLAEASRIFLPSHFLFPAAPPTLDLYLYQGPAHQRQAPPLLPHILTHTDPLRQCGLT